MCCTGPAWKREAVQDHKFDFIDTKEFHSKAFGIRLQYMWLYILVIKSFLVYISDIYTATTMLTSSSWSNKIFSSCKEKDGCVAIPFGVGKWLFVGCIIFSFLLLAYEARKAKKIIASRDISFAFTNVMAQNYYSLRSYDHFCFFCHINDSTKKKDDFAFFIFFTFKEWKRLLLADGPRQTINALTLYSFYLAKSTDKRKWWDASKYFDSKDMVTNILLVSIVFTVLIFIGSLLLLIAAAILYVPLLCYIRGMPANLTYGGPYFNISLSLTDLENTASNIKNTNAVVIRTGFSTHAFNMGQRVLKLRTSYTVADDGSATLHVSQMPNNPAIFAPGPAMLFITVNGVPSLAQWVMVGSGTVGTQPTQDDAVLPDSYIPSTQDTGSGNNGNSAGFVTAGISRGLTATVAVVLSAVVFGASLL